MTTLNHSPYFWIDGAGLIGQAIYLWIAASKIEKTDWPIGAVYVITCVLSLFSAFWPIFQEQEADIMRRCLHGFTAISFYCNYKLISRDYRDRKGEGSWNLNWKWGLGGFLALSLIVMFTIPITLSIAEKMRKGNEGQLNDIQAKAATAADVGMSTETLASENLRINQKQSQDIGDLKSDMRTLVKMARGVPALKSQIIDLKLEVKRLRTETSRRATIIYVPERYKPKEPNSALSPDKVKSPR